MPLKITFLDSGREPRCPPNPAYPDGMEVDLSFGGLWCLATLPYPAPRCGAMLVECDICEIKIIVTVAGRPDDPRTVKVGCEAKHKN
jgi:hypothetical protein